jgi:hypothetical protein
LENKSINEKVTSYYLWLACVIYMPRPLTRGWIKAVKSGSAKKKSIGFPDLIGAQNEAVIVAPTLNIHPLCAEKIVPREDFDLGVLLSGQNITISHRLSQI